MLNLCFLLCMAWAVNATDYRVTNAEEFNKTAKKVKAGDKIVLASGVWQDAALVLKRAQGTAQAPVVVTVEEKGKTTLEGRSNIRFSGEYVIVEGLVFQNPKDTMQKMVIEFKTSSTDYANHSVVRECVVKDFNPSDKTYQTTWLSLWGKYNTVEYCYFGGKTNQGTTFIVWPNDSASMENHHHIHHNYFGYRKPLGGNGGETIRVGTSHVCKNNSQTIIEDNYFEHCSGEVEIISIKSCENIIRRNTFFESEGSVVLRHGDRNEVYDNVFIGNGKRHTGGVRIINADHKVYNNFFYKLGGKEFRGSLVVMNGIPNSLPNGYEKVRNVTIENNTFVSCTSPMEFCNGKGTRDRDDKPENVLIKKNVFFCPTAPQLVTEYDTNYDIRLVDNVMEDMNGRDERGASAELEASFWNDMYMPMAKGYGFQPKADQVLATATTCGPQWYKATEEVQTAKVDRAPKTWAVEAGTDLLLKAIKKAQAGDVLELADGMHITSKVLKLDKDITLRAAANAKPVVATVNESNTVKLIEIGNNARVELQGLHLVGDHSEAHPAKYCFALNKETANNYVLIVDKCEISGFMVDKGAVFKANVNTFADTIIIRNSNVHNCFRGFALAEEKEEKGLYNAESVVFSNTIFSAITEWVLDYNRLGMDESTTGGSLLVDHCVFNEVNDRPDQVALRQKGIHNVLIKNSIFCNSECKNAFRLEGKLQQAQNCCFYLCGPAKATAKAPVTDMLTDVNPKFEKKSFVLSKKSPLAGKATDGGNIGLK